MFESSSLNCSKYFFDVCSYTFVLTDDIYDTLKNEKSNVVTLDVKENIGSLINGNRSFNAVIKYENLNEHIVYKDDMMNICELRSANYGTIIVKDPPHMNDRDRMAESDISKTLSHQSGNRKRYSSNAFDMNQPSKRPTMDKNTRNDEAGYPHKHINQDRMLPLSKDKSGHGDMMVKNMNMSKEFIPIKAEKRQEPHRELIPKPDPNNRKSAVKPISKPKNNVSVCPSNLSDSSKVKIDINFDIQTVNKKMVFDDERRFIGISGKIPIVDVHKKKTDPKADFNNNFSKPSDTKDHIRPPSSVIPAPSRQTERPKAHGVASKPMPNSISKTTAPQIDTKKEFTEPTRKQDSHARQAGSRQAHEEAKQKVPSHSTEPYSKTQDELILKTQALTEPKAASSKTNASPFEYVVLNPASTEFRPDENPSRHPVNRDPDTDEFRKDVLATFYRLQDCEKIYSRYSDKREELKTRALKSRTERDLADLYEELHRLVEEERRSFFLDLEKEITVLQDKLYEVSSIMGVTIS